MSKLKPCPFCGATYEKFTLSQEITAQFKTGGIERQLQEIKLSCPCGCSFEKEVFYVSEFVEAWNRRASDDHNQ